MSKRERNTVKHHHANKIMTQVFGDSNLVFHTVAVLILLGWTADTWIEIIPVQLGMLMQGDFSLLAIPEEDKTKTIGGITLSFVFLFYLIRLISRARKDKKENHIFVKTDLDNDREVMLVNLSPLNKKEASPDDDIPELSRKNVNRLYQDILASNKVEYPNNALSQRNWMMLLCAIAQNPRVNKIIIVTTGEEGGSHEWFGKVSEFIASIDGRSIQVEHMSKYLPGYENGIKTTQSDELSELAPKLVESVIQTHGTDRLLIDITSGLAAMSVALAVPATLWNVPVQYIHMKTYERSWNNSVNLMSLNGRGELKKL